MPVNTIQEDVEDRGSIPLRSTNSQLKKPMATSTQEPIEQDEIIQRLLAVGFQQNQEDPDLWEKEGSRRTPRTSTFIKAGKLSVDMWFESEVKD